MITLIFLYIQLLSRAQQEAGLIYLMEGKYTQALELMHQGNVDVREVCYLTLTFTQVSFLSETLYEDTKL